MCNVQTLQDPPQVTHGCAQMVWDASSRTGVLSFNADDCLTRDTAQAIVDALEAWVGDDGRPFGLVCDCTGVGRTDAGWRAVWFEYLRSRRQQTAIAWVNPSPSIRIVVTMFRTAMQTLGAFDATVTATVDEARTWLADHGYALT